MANTTGVSAGNWRSSLSRYVFATGKQQTTGLHAASAAAVAAGQQPFNVEAAAETSLTPSSNGKGWGLLNLLIVASSVSQATAEGVQQAASNSSPVSALLKGATASVLTTACASAAACVSPACDYISSKLDEALSPVTTATASAAGKDYGYSGGAGLMSVVPPGGFSLQGSVVGGGMCFISSSSEDPIATAAARALKVRLARASSGGVVACGNPHVVVSHPLSDLELEVGGGLASHPLMDIQEELDDEQE